MPKGISTYQQKNMLHSILNHVIKLLALVTLPLTKIKYTLNVYLGPVTAFVFILMLKCSIDVRLILRKTVTTKLYRTGRNIFKCGNIFYLFVSYRYNNVKKCKKQKYTTLYYIGQATEKKIRRVNV